jgi:hypothetical protein
MKPVKALELETITATIVPGVGVFLSDRGRMEN